MKPTGKPFQALLLMAWLLLSLGARAELTASVDRDRVAMGDTVRLTVTATGNEPINNIDLRPLLKDFEILQRSSSSTTNIINGERTSVRTVNLDITPRREGSLRIPSMRVGRSETNYLLVAVGPATASSGDPLVSFEAELDRDSVYVQGQAILTLRIQQAINLDSRSVTELQLDNAFVKQLEQNSFQRQIGGRPWLVHEIRYAIFPEHSGTLEIPAQTFSARESKPRRSMFDVGGTGPLMRRTSEALTLEVLPKPDTFPGGTWLPAGKLEISENWSTPPEELRVGESATRRVVIRGEGLQGAQLPPVQLPSSAGLKYYPDQPVIKDSETGSGLIGIREDSAALVPTREGNWDIPEIRIPWWDTTSGEVRYAVLPGRQLTVSPSLENLSPLNIPKPEPVAAATATGFDAGPITVAPAPATSNIWQIIAGVSVVGWLLTLLYFTVLQKSTHEAKDKVEENPGEAGAYKQLQAACTTGNAGQARRWLIEWTSALFPGSSIHSLEQVETALGDASLAAELTRMNTALYSPKGSLWDGQALAEIARKQRKKRTGRQKTTAAPLGLYPQGA